MGHSRNDVGMGAVAIRPRRYSNEPTFFVAQVWGSRRVSQQLKVSGIAAFDADAVAGGAALAWLPLRSSRLTFGVEAELGYAWASLGVPFAAEIITDRVTVYSAPRLGNWGSKWTPSLPLGMELAGPHGMAVRLEAQVNWADFQYYNRRLQVGLALAYQFGDTSK
jgi:hypothetical protein